MKFFAGILLIVSIFLLVANCGKAVSIDDLKREMFSYDELPDSVKLLFVNARQYAGVSGNSSLLYADSSLRYTLNAIESFGSFIDYYEITDESSKKNIRIPYGKILPFVIHDGILYIPTVYNVQNDLSKAAQSRYEGYHIYSDFQ